jgi:hypothetical protein
LTDSAAELQQLGEGRGVAGCPDFLGVMGPAVTASQKGKTKLMQRGSPIVPVPAETSPKCLKGQASPVLVYNEVELQTVALCSV